MVNSIHTYILLMNLYTIVEVVNNFYVHFVLLQPRLLDEKQTTIYKRAVDKNYHLKMKASRFIFSEINQKFPIMPFSVRS